MDVEVVRSARRKKTVQARVVDGKLRVSIPATMTRDEEAHWVDVMRERVLRKSMVGEIDLSVRAELLATRLGLELPRTIEWSERQKTLWGSCTVADGAVRISTRVSGYPPWVVDYVIVHELAHLSVANHSNAFWEIVSRYEHADRARGYLEAKSDGL
ncbi:MAG: M48 family metallopeptidase [Acidimicrobiia bacterium]|nr:M48 family metallopeptidase [Acidimicrobiia bacterium]NNC76188.1 M48 family metallopeptidase [Acidimicrobiia bacterium]